MVDVDGGGIEDKRAKRKKRLGDAHGSVDASLLVVPYGVLGWDRGGAHSLPDLYLLPGKYLPPKSVPDGTTRVCIFNTRPLNPVSSLGNQLLSVPRSSVTFIY